MEVKVVRLDQLFEALKKRWLMIASVTLVATIILIGLSFFMIKPQYEASVKVFIGKDGTESKNYNESDVMMYQQLMQTYAESIKTKDLIERSLKGTNIELEPLEVLNNLTVETLVDTQMLKMKYKNNNPEIAKAVIEEVSKEFVKTSKELVPNGNIEIIESIELSEDPGTTNKKMNIAIAFLLALMIGAGLAILLEFLEIS